MIVYYDGVCALCNGFVRWAVRHDTKRCLRFASLESSHGQHLRYDFPETQGVDSIVLHDGKNAYVRSDAILRIAAAFGGIWRAAVLLRVVPRATRDYLYDVVARHRYRWFGRLEACPIPPPEVRDRFLD